MNDYLAAVLDRVAAAAQREHENAEEAAAAKAKALDDARRYVWGLNIQEPSNA